VARRGCILCRVTKNVRLRRTSESQPCTQGCDSGLSECKGISSTGAGLALVISGLGCQTPAPPKFWTQGCDGRLSVCEGAVQQTVQASSAGAGLVQAIGGLGCQTPAPPSKFWTQGCDNRQLSEREGAVQQTVQANSWYWYWYRAGAGLAEQGRLSERKGMACISGMQVVLLPGCRLQGWEGARTRACVTHRAAYTARCLRIVQQTQIAPPITV
jgi:hypothetical protein